MSEVVSVSELNHYVKLLMDQDELLSKIAVHGELSNYKTYPSGHHYFSLKDAEGSIRGILFRREAMALRFRPQNGMHVIALGRVSVFPRDGQYQLYCSHMQPAGLGALHLAFEQIKAKLSAEGLFDQGYKKPLPRYPGRIALLTSPAGAAVRDMIRILAVRYPAAKVLVTPVRVQGEEAKSEICAALAMLNRYKSADLILLGRGGGSMEDLWAFNEESVARAIFASDIPVISAVGHEPDVTIADYVADLRAATPSNAAELAVPDARELSRCLLTWQQRMKSSLSHQLNDAHHSLDRAAHSPWLRSPLPIMQESHLLLDAQQRRMTSALEKRLVVQRKQLGTLAASLDALSPLKVLARGYSLTQGVDGSIKCSVTQVEEGDHLYIRLSDGSLCCRVERKEPI